MCVVHICTQREVVKADPAALAVKVRLAWAVELMESWHKPKSAASHQKPVARVRTTYAPAPLQRGGDLFKHLPDECWSKKDSASHYSQRCGEHNHREQVFHKTERRRQVVRY